jgi:hypothetical protein
MKITRSRFLFATLTLTLPALFIAGLAWAQSDTPIIIADGSLNMRSATPWAQFGTGARNRRHPDANKTVTAIDLTINGNQQTFNFSNQKATVTVAYGSTTITVSTGDNGKGLQVDTDFSQFRPGSDGNVLSHVNPNGRIGAVSVSRGTASVFSGTGSGGTVITVHYR